MDALLLLNDHRSRVVYWSCPLCPIENKAFHLTLINNIVYERERSYSTVHTRPIVDGRPKWFTLYTPPLCKAIWLPTLILGVPRTSALLWIEVSFVRLVFSRNKNDMTTSSRISSARSVISSLAGQASVPYLLPLRERQNWAMGWFLGDSSA